MAPPTSSPRTPHHFPSFRPPLVLLHLLFLFLAPHHILTTAQASRSPRLDHVQTVGVHNSYHVQPRASLLKLLNSFSTSAKAWEYTHKGLPDLLACGVRSFELDVYYDPAGGLFSNRMALKFVNAPTRSPDQRMYKPGYKVLHIQDLDFETTCPTLKLCLQQMKTWSLRNPRHLPIIVKLEVKYESVEALAGKAAAALLPGAAVPKPITRASLLALEAEVQEVVGRGSIVMPDFVRGRFASLAAAVAARGWPTVSQLAGKFIFALVPNAAVTTYRSISPNLAGRLFFTGPTSGGMPDAAIITLDAPSVATIRTSVPSLLKKNVLVWARTDQDTWAARKNDVRLRDAVLSSGVQVVSTDYPACERPNPFGTPYFVALPGLAKARCTPEGFLSGCRAWMLQEPVPQI